MVEIIFIGFVCWVVFLGIRGIWKAFTKPIGYASFMDWADGKVHGKGWIKGHCHHCNYWTYISQDCEKCGLGPGVDWRKAKEISEAMNGGWGIFCKGCGSGFTEWVCMGCKKRIRVRVDYRPQLTFTDERKDLKNIEFVIIPPEELDSNGYPKDVSG